MVTKTLSLVLVSTLTTAWRTCRSTSARFRTRAAGIAGRARDAVEFAEALHHAGGVGAHGVHGFEDGDEHEDADDGGNDKKENNNSGIVHDDPFMAGSGAGAASERGCRLGPRFRDAGMIPQGCKADAGQLHEARSMKTARKTSHACVRFRLKRYGCAGGSAYLLWKRRRLMSGQNSLNQKKLRRSRRPLPTQMLCFQRSVRQTGNKDSKCPKRRRRRRLRSR
jgi:hypothetical protein